MKEQFSKYSVDRVNIELNEYAVDHKQLPNASDKKNVTRYSKASRKQLLNNNVEKPEKTL